MTRQIVSLDQDGNPVGCRMETVGVPALPTCIDPSGKPPSFPQVEKPGNAVSEMIGETHFYPVEAAKVTAPGGQAGSIKLGQHVSELVIGADGRVTECKAIRVSGSPYAERDVCELFDLCRFSPAEADSGPLRGTIVLTAYVRQRSAR